MKILLLMLAASAAWGQKPSWQEKVFNQSCGSGYCHGARGAGAGAPRLSARGFTRQFIEATVQGGVKGTSMPSFSQTLTPAELAGVVSFVASLNDSAQMRYYDGRPKLTGERKLGQDLFKDAVRGFGRCVTCHQEDGVGIPVTPPIHAIPKNAVLLKALATPRVATVTANGDTLPALILAKKANEVTYYDLTSAPPVLRTVAPGEFKSVESSVWKHSDFIKSYSDAELAAILAYLRTVVR